MINIRKKLTLAFKGFAAGLFTNENELRDLMDHAHNRGLVESDEHEMIHNVFELGDTLVRELMVPRTDMVWIESDKTLRQGLSLALRSGYSRIPVVGTGIDNIIGIAYVKDLARRALDHHEAETTEKVEQHIRPAVFVPENKEAAELLKEMQRDQIHLAIVVDEYGGTAGIITIEDIIEEIVGEITDEFDERGLIQQVHDEGGVRQRKLLEYEASCLDADRHSARVHHAPGGRYLPSSASQRESMRLKASGARRSSSVRLSAWYWAGPPSSGH